MRIRFATTLITAMWKAHANHNGSERYSTYKQHDSAFSVWNNEDGLARNPLSSINPL